MFGGTVVVQGDHSGFDSDTLTITGGVVDVTTTEDCIRSIEVVEITIFDGTLKAVGGDVIEQAILCDTMSVFGGTVEAKGVGAGSDGITICKEMRVSGGTVKAAGSDGVDGAGSCGGASGIGLGYGLNDHNVKVIITGGTVTATGGKGCTDSSGEVHGGGAGIGTRGGSEGQHNEWGEDEIEIIVTGGTVTATGGDGPAGYEEYAGAGIGGGCWQNSGTIKIQKGLVGSTVIATHGGQGTVTNAENIGHGHNGTNNGVIDLEARFFPDEPDTPDDTDGPIIPNKAAEIEQFYTADGVFMLDQPQKLTITQGDGKTTSIMLYANDTMQDVARKINDAIADSLGQGAYIDNRGKFCTLADGTANTSESVYQREPIYSDELYKRDGTGEYVMEYDEDGNEVWRRDGTGEYILDADGNRIPLTLEERLIGYNVYSTMLVRSAIPGHAGELSFSGDQDLLNALGLNTIRESSESSYTASVYNAHTGAAVATNVRVTGNRLNGIIRGNIDVEFDAMSGIVAKWNENTKSYTMTGGRTSLTLHLVDNGMAFQVGANKGEELFIHLGDMSTDALGVTNVNVTTRERAARAIGTLDRAINRVSAQRAKIGAYQNSLEYTTENLTTTMTNLTAAESRIRDADMAKEMMELVKLQILNQSGTSMLSQANQLPQQVLSLIGG